MIDFACSKIELSEIIMCSFNLSKTDYNLLLKLSGFDKSMTVQEISELSNLERSTVQKSLKNLLSNSLVSRSQTNMSRGGYVFRYKSIGRQEIKKRIMQTIESWNRRVEKEVMSW